jgi:hypothetical protein
MASDLAGVSSVRLRDFARRAFEKWVLAKRTFVFLLIFCSSRSCGGSLCRRGKACCGKACCGSISNGCARAV